MSSATLQDHPSVESFFNVVETETLALFEHLSFEFLEEFDVFAPAKTVRTRDLEPPEMMRGFLHCYSKNIYGIRPVERELNNTVVWLSCGFDRPPSRDAVDRFLADLEHVVDRVFDHLVEQTASRGLLDLTYSIDSTDVRAIPMTSTTMATAARSSRLGKRSRLQPSSPRANKHQKRRRCASRVTRSTSGNRCGCLETALTTRSSGTTTY